MSKIAILADSTCDLSDELIERYQITIFPLHIHLGDKDCLDGQNIFADEIYRWSEEHKATPKTSTVSPTEAQEYIKKALGCAQEVICFCISGEMSTCGSVMQMMAEECGVADRVFIIDSRNLSTGIGLQIIRASLMAEKGMRAKDIFDEIREIQPLVRASFVVDTLTYLHRGGRCSGLAALAGGALKLHPYISVTDGKMHPGKKYRGKMDKAIREYVEDLKPELLKAQTDRVFITHSGCDETMVQAVKQQLEELHHFEEILITRAGGVVSSHCGPGTLGVLFIAEKSGL